MQLDILKKCEFCKEHTASRTRKVFNASTLKEDEIRICVKCHMVLSKNKENHGTSNSNAIVK